MNRKTFILVKATFGIVLALSGITILYNQTNGLVVLAIILMLWGNNIGSKSMLR